MTSSDDTFSNRPFMHLDRILKRKTAASRQVGRPSTPAPADSGDTSAPAASERQMFLDAVRDATPIQKKNRSFPPNPPLRKKGLSTPQDANEPYQKLVRLVASGEGFVVSQTPEYMEGTGQQVPCNIAQQLHQGRFSIQDHIDLHGMDAPGALEALEHFLQKATKDGLRSVLVIHGRGLSSTGEPVLKTKLRELLVGSRWRKWILAFSSARSCDGGAGATYVLLRKNPLPRKLRRKPTVQTENKHQAPQKFRK